MNLLTVSACPCTTAIGLALSPAGLPTSTAGDVGSVSPPPSFTERSAPSGVRTGICRARSGAAASAGTYCGQTLAPGEADAARARPAGTVRKECVGGVAAKASTSTHFTVMDERPISDRTFPTAPQIAMDPLVQAAGGAGGGAPRGGGQEGVVNGPVGEHAGEHNAEGAAGGSLRRPNMNKEGPARWGTVRAPCCRAVWGAGRSVPPLLLLDAGCSRVAHAHTDRVLRLSVSSRARAATGRGSSPPTRFIIAWRGPSAHTRLCY